MTTSQTDQDTVREQVRARYAAAATKITAGHGDCGCRAAGRLRLRRRLLRRHG